MSDVLWPLVAFGLMFLLGLGGFLDLENWRRKATIVKAEGLVVGPGDILIVKTSAPQHVCEEVAVELIALLGEGRSLVVGTGGESVEFTVVAKA